MITLPNYQYYQSVYKGTASEGVFNDYCHEAGSLVADLIGLNKVDTDKKQEAVNMAVCTAIDAYAAYGALDAGSFTIGSFSISGGSTSGHTEAKKRAKGELFSAGLLWGGIL